VTQVTAADMEDRDAGEGYEMDIVEQYPSDAGSERRIIHPAVLNHSDDKRESRTSRKSVRRNGVRVDVEYHVDRSER